MASVESTQPRRQALEYGQALAVLNSPASYQAFPRQLSAQRFTTSKSDQRTAKCPPPPEGGLGTVLSVVGED